MAHPPRWANGLLHLLAPTRCPGCDGALPFEVRGFCPVCEPLLDRLRDAPGAFAFGGPAAEAVHALKYRGRTEHAAVLGEALAARARRLAGRVDAVVPVPLHPRRRRARGFNQSDLLGVHVARSLALPLDRGALRRVRDTLPQARLVGTLREDNVRGAFVARPGGVPRRPLLIDDVRTTGATFAACAATLRSAGAEQVFALAVTCVQ
ncbi:MAG: ComF family protein [Myxococcales bacterium]|nr:ComF family protein [Myxococcales bacterium]